MRPDRSLRAAAGTRPPAGAEAQGLAAQTVVTFGLGEAFFALPIAPVLEILDMRDVAPLPRAPAHLLGLIDRRGVSVPVVDMRRLLGQPAQDTTLDTRIVVLGVDHAPAAVVPQPDSDARAPTQGVVGLRVDRVIEVTTLDAPGSETLAEADWLQWNERMVAGIGRRNGAFVTVLDIDHLFGPIAPTAGTAQAPHGRAPSPIDAQPAALSGAA